MMANWLQKVSQSSLAKIKTVNLPAIRPSQALTPLKPGVVDPAKSLPPASIIYGVAASALCVMALYFLVTGRFFVALLVLLPAIAMFGFALHFIKRNGGF